MVDSESNSSLHTSETAEAEGDIHSTIQVQQSIILGQRLGFGRDFFQNLCRHFLQPYAEFEHRRFRTSPPASHLPMRPYELHVGMRCQVQQHRRLLAIELLRKRHHWLRTPCGSVDCTIDANFE